MGTTGSLAQLGLYLHSLTRKGDQAAAMAAGKGPVTAEWAKEHGYTEPVVDLPSAKSVTELSRGGAEIYKLYVGKRIIEERKEKVKKETRRKLEEQRRRAKERRLLRRPSRERGIL